MALPKDIIERIAKDFHLSEQEGVLELLTTKVARGLNVGPEQYMRSALFLADGNIGQLKKELTETDDPRDTVMEAEMKAGALGHWFIIPFNEIEELINTPPY